MTTAPIDLTTGVADRGKEIVAAVQALVTKLEARATKANDRVLAAGKIQEIAQVFDAARAAYEAVIAADPRNGEAQARLALVLLKLRNNTRALQVARQLVATDAKFTFNDLTGRPRSAQTVLGDASRATGDLAAAKTAYTAARALQPSDSYSAFKLAQIHVANGDIDQATKLSGQFLSGPDEASFRSTINLLANDPHRLPAIGGVVTDFGRIFADNA